MYKNAVKNCKGLLGKHGFVSNRLPRHGAGHLLKGYVAVQAEHLAHWGINVALLQKTEKTMAELQIDLNMSFEFNRITEAGAALQPLSGPGWVRGSL